MHNLILAQEYIAGQQKEGESISLSHLHELTGLSGAALNQFLQANLKTQPARAWQPSEEQKKIKNARNNERRKAERANARLALQTMFIKRAA